MRNILSRKMNSSCKDSILFIIRTRPDSLMEERLTPNEQIQVRFLFGAPKLPLNLCHTMLSQESICFAEVSTTEESSMSWEGRRVRRFENYMFLGIDERFFLLSMASPEEEYEKFSFIRESFYNGIREVFPSFSRMWHGLSCTDCECGIQEQDSLLCPAW